MVRWTAAAVADLERIWIHRATWTSIEAADTTVAQLQLLANNIGPTDGQATGGPYGERKKWVLSVGFVIIFLPVGSDVEIVGVFGRKENWTGRMGSRQD